MTGTGAGGHAASTPGDGAPGYAEMMAELDSILAELERADVDVDRLAERVSRAAWLVEACRDRIERARLEVERVVATVDPATGRGPAHPPAERDGT